MRQSRSATIFVGLVALGVLAASGCASVAPRPFARFSAAVQELRTGADEALRATSEGNRERFIQRVVEETGQGNPATLTGALLLEPEASFGWSYEMELAPLYVESRRLRAGVQSLNDALVAYAGLLVDLAAPELVDRETFDQLAMDLNANLNAAANQLGVSQRDGARQGIAIFSAAGSAAVHSYIERQRQEAFQNVLSETQTQIELLSTDLIAAMGVAARNLHRNYAVERGDFADAIASAVDRQDGSAAERKSRAATRREAVEGLIELNEDYTGRLGALERLHHAYSILPTAHNELQRAVETPGMNMATVQALYGVGKDLHTLYKELVPTDE